MGKNKKDKEFVLKIEHGIPVPKKGKYAGNSVTHLLRQMRVGDSLFVPGIAVQTMSSRLSRYHPKRFTQRTVDGGVRIWRIE